MPDAPTVPLAEVAGRYTIERELGRGATAVVYLARDRSTERSVALKVLRPELAESLSAERFLREIRLTQQLDHPHIAPVLDSGVAGGLFFCVLDYMDGGTLRDRLDSERQLPMADIAAITRAVGGALDYAHRNKIIHRDVKPENILFGGGQACLADFGIARALETLGGPTTSTGVVRGTPAYMSPEQASGEREYDGRSDVYSLACVLYEAIAGVPAFAGPNTQAVLAQRLIHVPRPLHVYRPTVTAELDAVMTRALATAPADRYQSAAGFAEALCTAIDNAASPTAVTAERSAAEARARLVRRRRWMWGGGIVAAGLVALVLGPLKGMTPWASDETRARHEWARGQQAFSRSRLDIADSAFARAAALDTAFVEPALWLALVRTWAGLPRSRWRPALDRAMARSTELTNREASIAIALAAEADSAWERACPVWRNLTNADRTDFVGWYGLARCLGADDLAIPDSLSPSSWVFRTSAEEMVQAYRRAFELEPAALAAGRPGGFERVRDLLYARSDVRRRGRTSPGGTVVVADAVLDKGDTLALVPFEYTAYVRGIGQPAASARRDALIRERRLLREIAASWVASTPDNPAAVEALAVSMKLAGDPAAIDTLLQARRLAVTPADRNRLAATEVWFLITASFPDDTAGLRHAYAIADSLLATAGAADAESTASIAALLGRITLAARLSEAAGTGTAGPALPHAPSLLAYAAFGGPVDSIRRLEPVVTTSINSATLTAEQVRVRQQWLQHAAAVAFPDVQLAGLQRLGTEGVPLLEAEAAFATGNRATAQRYLDGLPAIRQSSGPENISLDVLYPEARLLMLLGENARAAQWLDPTLQAVSRTDPKMLARLTNAAALVRTAALRGDLAAGAGDSTAAGRWARVVVVLWAGADAFLQPTVRRMQRLAGVPTLNSRGR